MITRTDLLRMSRRAVNRPEPSGSLHHCLAPASPKNIFLSPALVSAFAKAEDAFISHGMAGVSVALARVILAASAIAFPWLLARHRRFRGTAPIRSRYRGRPPTTSWSLVRKF